jgi:TatD DNase family protein
MWIDTHCHLDAREFDADRDAVVARARAAGVSMIVLQSVDLHNLDTVRVLAHRHGLAYAMGIHPMCTGEAREDDLERLEEAVRRHLDDPRLVAIGEMGLDHFLPDLDRDRQEFFYRGQLKIAQRTGLPVILHARKSADGLLAGLRRIEVAGGIAHAFNASDQQADQFVARDFRLGFGGNVTFDRARQIQHLAATLPAQAIVMETDAPDIPPHWLYRTAATREGDAAHAALPQARNEPAELPRIAASLAALRGMDVEDVARLTTANACAALPRLAALITRDVAASPTPDAA